MPPVVCCETTQPVNDKEAVVLLSEERQRLVEAGMPALDVGICLRHGRETARAYVDALAPYGGREPDLAPGDLVNGMQERFCRSTGKSAGS